MATATQKGFWDISPVRKDDTDKENDVPVLSLIQFSKAPFVSFGTVKIGTSKSAVLRIENPNEDVDAVVTVEKIASSKGFSVDHNTFTVEGERSFSLTITWTPAEEGGVRELIIFCANGVVKHQAVLLGRAEAPKKKKKTLWDSIKNKPGKVSGPRVKKADSALKMAANKTFQVSRKPQYKLDRPRSPLASLNQEKTKRERSLSQKRSEDKPQNVLVSAAQDDICSMQENSPLVCRVPEMANKQRNSQDFLTLPENNNLAKVLNKTLSPVGTPDRLKKLMPRIDPVESPLFRESIKTENTLNNTPTLSIKDALALIDSDLSPINSSPQESSSEFSDSLESKSGQFDAKQHNPQTPEINEPRLTFFVSKKVILQDVKMFTSTTVTKSKATVEINPTSGRKIKKSRRRLLEKTLELSDSSSQAESCSGTPCLPVIDAEANSPNANENVNIELKKEVDDYQVSAYDSPIPVTFLTTSPLPEVHHTASTRNSSHEQPVSIVFTVATPPKDSPSPVKVVPSAGGDTVPIVSSQPFLASSPESFPIHVAGKGKKRKSEEFLMADVKSGNAGKSERVKRSRVLTVKTEPCKERRAAVQRQQPKPAGAPSVKSSAQKSKVVAVAQSKLTFIKPTQTAIPRHPMPFAAKNMFFDERWIEKQERGFTLSALSVAMGSEQSVPKAPTKEEMSFSTYTARRKLNRLRRAACELFTSETMVKAIQRLELEVEAKRLLVRKDRHLWKDIGERQKVLNWLLSYNPLWLRIGLEFRHPKVPHLYRDGHEEALSRFTLKKLLLLVCSWTKPKSLTSKDLLLAFSRDFLSGEGILPRHMGYLGLPVSHQQKPLDEFNFAVKNLAVDLKCGIRLVCWCRLESVLKLRLPAISRLQKVHNVDLALQVLKKKAWTSRTSMYFNKFLYVPFSGSAIDSRDIVDGHREKTLALLWKIIHLKLSYADFNAKFHLKVEVILNEEQLKEEICFLRKALKTKRRLAYLRTDRGLQPSPIKNLNQMEHCSDKIRLLMDWVRAVCGKLHCVFSDGRVLCFLIHHYHPSLVPEPSISQSTTQTVESSPRGRLQLDCSDADSDSSFESSPSIFPFKELLENEKNKLPTSQQRSVFLGGVPAMINAADMSNTIPNEKVVMFVPVVSMHSLLDLRNETRAARVIQLHGENTTHKGSRTLPGSMEDVLCHEILSMSQVSHHCGPGTVEDEKSNNIV
ncbi:hypothetical protein WMY93_025105 [Mugilogobius chulae]|uniref:Abnormal spindle-like microcephaly-associated protein ASH domain-containing protein n=1 Tax=Mugilogobius chulae TaxID=88201 RepID=A0AAW0N6D1_9GOBI